MESILTFEQRATPWMSGQERNTFQPGPKYWSQTYEWARWSPGAGNPCQPPHHLQQYAGSRHWHCHWKGNQKGEWLPRWGADKRPETVWTASKLGPRCSSPQSLEIELDPPNLTPLGKEKANCSAKGQKTMWNESLYTTLFFQQILTVHPKSKDEI